MTRLIDEGFLEDPEQHMDSRAAVKSNMWKISLGGARNEGIPEVLV